MKKNIIYIFFLIILPISFGNSESTGCNGIKQSDNKEQVEKTSYSENSSDNNFSANSEK